MPRGPPRCRRIRWRPAYCQGGMNSSNRPSVLPSLLARAASRPRVFCRDVSRRRTRRMPTLATTSPAIGGTPVASETSAPATSTAAPVIQPNRARGGKANGSKGKRVRTIFVNGIFFPARFPCSEAIPRHVLLEAGHVFVSSSVDWPQPACLSVFLSPVVRRLGGTVPHCPSFFSFSLFLRRFRGERAAARALIVTLPTRIAPVHSLSP
jgi:hypothetical protein